MSTLPGTSVLLTDIEGDYPYRTTLPTRRLPSWTRAALDPGDDQARHRLAATTGRAVSLCHACGAPAGDQARQRANGTRYCAPCADQTVRAYYAHHPKVLTARRSVGAPRAWTGTSYLAAHERYAVRFHAGNGRWQVSDTQTRRWTRCWDVTEAGADAIAARLNTAWRTQIDSEKLRFSRHRWDR